MSRLGEDIGWGARLGLLMGVVYCGFGGLLYLVQFGFVGGPVQLPSLLAMYLLGGIAGGAIVGILRPVLGSPWGAVSAGTASLLPFGFATIMMFSGPMAEWGVAEYVGTCLSAFLLGGYAGYDLWKDERADLAPPLEKKKSLKLGNPRRRPERRRNSR